jgi:hypothetical protein
MELFGRRYLDMTVVSIDALLRIRHYAAMQNGVLEIHAYW